MRAGTPRALIGGQNLSVHPVPVNPAPASEPAEGRHRTRRVLLAAVAAVALALTILTPPAIEASAGDIAELDPGADQGSPFALRPSQGAPTEVAVQSLEPLAIYYGVIQPALGEPLPVKVRALGEDGTTCGTSDVSPASNGVAGAYAVTVYSNASKAGCPEPGGTIRFALLYDKIDPGVPAAQTARWEAGRHPLNLTRADEVPSQGRFLGDVPDTSGYALLSWSGPATPTAAALRTLPRDAEAAYHIEAFVIRRYVPGAPEFVSDYLQVNPGDIVIVRFP